MGTLRLRQVALVAHDLDAACKTLEAGLGLREPFADPGVGQFGLHNAVYEIGLQFLEVVSPIQDDTAAGRYMKRHGEGGYMAIFQLGGFGALHEVRARLPQLGIRPAWNVDYDDIATTHLHPKDVPGAIVSIDAAEPPDSWRWGGPRWIGAAPPDRYLEGAIESITVAVDDPGGVSRLWSSVLGHGLDPLPGGQSVRFVEGIGGIVEVKVSGTQGEAVVGGATIRGQ